MQFEITSINSAYRSYDEDIDVSEFFKDKEIIGKVFDNEDEMQEAILKLAQEYQIDIESFSFDEHTTEEDDEAAWDETVSAAYEEAESSGRSFDHIMGEILAGIH